ncbi:MAG: NADH-quinone oxidoreductase subunit H [Acidimicrobiia bacterium]|nr:NADH-quinone oxidoreductase subunit H [Acidimicrobiia bacterium]
MTLLLAASFAPPYWLSTLIKVLVISAVVPTTALILGMVFLFKVMSWMQSRLGPQEAGPRGTLQLLADGVKFLQKEDIAPDGADLRVFRIAPLVVLMSTLLLYVALPASMHLVVANLDVGVFYVLAVSSLSVIGVLMAGYGSASKYSLMGALRAAGQLIAYELPMVLAVIGVVIQAGTLSLNGIVVQQADGAIFGWTGIGFPYILTQFLGFFIFIAAVQAELTQPPFDMPVAESEIVSGYQVEYTGFRFLLFFLAEFATAFVFAGIAAVLFLGGWAVPWLETSSDWYYVLGPAVLFAKVMLVSFLIFWVRFTYPRFREDQLQSFAWKVLIPLALVNIVITALLKVVL